MEEKWKRTNIDFGFLASLAVGAGTIFLAATWFLAWVDDRVADRAGSYQLRVEHLENRIEQLEGRQMDIRREIIILENEVEEEN